MHDVADWDKQACNLLKSELARRGLSYEDLRLALERIGVHKTKNNITKTISLGKFSFSFCHCVDFSCQNSVESRND